MNPQIPIDWLVCPVSRKPLTFSGDTAVGAETYQRNATHGYWNFVPAAARNVHGETYAMWEQLQENGEVSYREDPEHNLGVGERADHLAFADFCGFRGNILDVGCGPQKEPTHLKRARVNKSFFVGIDPLVGEQPRNFAFVCGLAEHLPFRDGVFDQVLFVTSLDHLLDPVGALREARRVTKPDGRVFLWMGEKDSGAPKPARSPAWYDALKTPKGADDVFHHKRLTLASARAMLAEAGLRSEEESVRVTDPWRRSAFLRLAPTAARIPRRP